LWALFAAVPIIIHLLGRRQTVRMNFSTVRFLDAGAVTASKRRRLRRLLLLLTRILIIIALALIFAGPYNPRNPFGVLRAPTRKIFVWIDPTISMDYVRNNTPLWKSALNNTGFLDSILSAGSRIMLFDHCRNTFAELDELQESSCKPVRHGGSDITAAVTEFAAANTNESQLHALILFSDFQFCDSAEFKSAMDILKNRFPLLCVSMAPQKTVNYSLSITRPPSSGLMTAGCEVSATGRGIDNAEISVTREDLRTGWIKLYVKQDSSAFFETGCGDAPLDKPGTIELKAEDPFVHDNIAYFPPSNRSSVHVLILADNEISAFPLTAALQTLYRNSGGTIKYANAAETSFDDIDPADVIILSSVTRPSPAITAILETNNFGGKVVIFAPELNESAGSFDSKVLNKFGIKTSVSRLTRPAFPVLPDTSTGLWHGFPLQEDRSVFITSHLSTIPGSVLISTGQNKPLLSFIKDSSNRFWVISSVPIGIDSSNNLAETGFYLPFLDRIITYGLSQTNPGMESRIAGTPFKNPFAGTNKTAGVFNSSGELIQKWNSQLLVVFDLPGVYRVRPDDTGEFWITVNSRPEECNLRYAIPQVPPNSGSPVKIITDREFRHFIKAISGDSGTNALWILLAILIIAETALWDRKKSA
jgi:hypothetical protein